MHHMKDLVLVKANELFLFILTVRAKKSPRKAVAGNFMCLSQSRTIVNELYSRKVTFADLH